jgi:uncharacterized repeat protein (TIGR01451 family)
MFLTRHRLWFWLGDILFAMNSLPIRAVTADLSPSGSMTDFARVGIPFTIELHLRNDGPDTVHNPVLTDVLPPEWSLMSCEILSYLRGFTIGTPYDPSAVLRAGRTRAIQWCAMAARSTRVIAARFF